MASKKPNPVFDGAIKVACEAPKGRFTGLIPVKA